MIKNENFKKTLKILCAILLVIVLVCIFVSTSPTVLADVGNNNRYDTDSSFSDSGDSGIFYLIWWLLFDLLGPIPGLIVLIIGVIIYFRMKKSGKLKQIQDQVKAAGENLSTVSTNDSNQTALVSDNIREIDPAFSEDLFIGWAREVFIKIQLAWTKREWREIRPFESNELFSQHSAQLQEYINSGKINVVEKIAVQYTALKEFRQDGDKEILIVELHAVMRDYVIDADTKKVLESDPNKDWQMKYFMSFQRKIGVKTNPGTSNKSTTNCPNCGAPTEITSAGQCEYCDSVITTGEHDWVLSDIRSIR